MGSIYLIRHGQASFGADNYDVLSANGIRQSEVLGAHLSRIGMRFDRCIAGGLLRQQHTAETTLAQLAAAGLAIPEVEIDSGFDEFDAEGVIRALLPAMLADEPQAAHVMLNVAQHPAEFQRLFVLVIGRWVSGRHDVPGLQSWESFVAQAHAALQRILARAEAGERIAVFTSGGTITALLHLITGIPAPQAFELSWQIVNTSFSQLKFRDQEVSLACFNSQAHLELMNTPQLITYR